ncbi:lysylphosphatidylglycerol synthase transmembrane domain-containing protein [Prevotella sp. FD3004]|uniref:lysylphosphatidylglycerol synthase transmembrane domain-containing protein n=1 Tax=Prevotella sp. FD3004 TaxID=1408309 RepID=UPI00056D1A37|nr:lysylphosphatidylglycerol synthase transmembrane domain-containing protein [Prevotella sp. FD3004]
MKKKYQNGFFIFGLIVLIVMVTQLDFHEVWAGVRHAGYWFLAVIALWGVLYMLNTASWYIIINSIGNEHGVCRKCKVGFWWLYKITVSAFALNYATPGGLMGGEPYRIMSLSPKIGGQKASSSVILFVMTHIYSHFWFWLLSVPLYLFTQKMTPITYILLPIIAAVALLAIWFFQRGYRKGIAVTGMKLLSHFPMVKKWAQPYVERNKDKLAEVDAQIAALHNQNPRTFVAAVLLELGCRLFSTLEIYFILLVIMPEVTIPQCVLIYAFTTLFANMLFFMPLQLGGREGGFLMSTEGLSLSAQAGIFVALLVRVRELIWTAVGLALIKFDKREK